MSLFAGQDGNFFIYSYMSQKDVDEKVSEAKIPSAIKLSQDQKLPDDIDDPHAYRLAASKSASVDSHSVIRKIHPH